MTKDDNRSDFCYRNILDTAQCDRRREALCNLILEPGVCADDRTPIDCESVRANIEQNFATGPFSANCQLPKSMRKVISDCEGDKWADQFIWYDDSASEVCPRLNSVCPKPEKGKVGAP